MSETCSFHSPWRFQSGLNSGHIVEHGTFFRRSDSKVVRRFRCKFCRKTFSLSTDRPCFGQNKRQVNTSIFRLLCSGVSQRRAARLLGVNLKTVARKLRFLAEQERLRPLNLKSGSISEVIVDEMETSIHTKLKPVSIAIAVSAKREVLGFEVSEMPAHGLIAKKSREKYGPRKDDRMTGFLTLLERMRPYLSTEVCFRSDENPRYPSLIERAFPNSEHLSFKGRRGCVVGQGELKKIGWDPLFELNHTAAMFRANVNRLFRRTWCTSKKVTALVDHLTLYMGYHNRILLQAT